VGPPQIPPLLPSPPLIYAWLSTGSTYLSGPAGWATLDLPWKGASLSLCLFFFSTGARPRILSLPHLPLVFQTGFPISRLRSLHKPQNTPSFFSCFYLLFCGFSIFSGKSSGLLLPYGPYAVAPNFALCAKRLIGSSWFLRKSYERAFFSLAGSFQPFVTLKV